MVTSTQDKFPGLPVGARAVQIADGNTATYFLTTFGRAKRETVCSCEVKMEPNLSQALHLINGDTTNAKIQQGGLVPKRLEEGKAPEDIISEMYVRCFSRKPTDEEVVFADRDCRGTGEQEGSPGRHLLVTAEFERVPV